MSKFVGVRVHRAYKIGILNHREQEVFWDAPNTALYIDWDIDPAENVNVLSSTLVMLYRARAPYSV